VINDKYETNDMLSSVKLGIAELEDADAVFLLPADNPFIKVNTLLSLQKQFENEDSSILYPVFAEKKGHPPLIARTLFVDIQSYVQEGGLRQILAMHEDKARCIPVEDQGIIIDADTQEDFATLELYGRKNFGISLSLCDELATELGFYEEDRDQALLEAVEAMEKGKVQIEDGQGCDLIMDMNLAYIHYLIQEDKAVEKEWIALLEKKGYIKVVNRIRKSQ
ncbi:MAG: NTP transferase domain-containing protein, partial [Vallitaleaceae bacterium]|nr:NTP transferase domain-containing protein [Vallitaleaceae bacterium]